MENNVPEDIIKAIIAAGGNSRAARSARSRKQLRDRYGRWIEMGGGLSFKFRMPNGDVVPVVGRSVGGSDSSDDAVQVYVPSSNRPDIREGFYTVPASSSETAKALLSEEQLKRAGIDTPAKEGSTDAGVIDFNDATFADAPEGWTKNEDGSFTTIEDNITITPNEDGTFSLSQSGEDKGSFNNIGDAIVESNDLDAEAELPEADKKKVAELRDAGDEEAAKKVIRNEPIATLPKDFFTPSEEDEKRAKLPGMGTKKDETPAEFIPAGEKQAELPRSEALINEDVAGMSREEVAAEVDNVRAQIAELRALPTDEQDPDALESLSDRLTDLTLRNQDLDKLDRGEPITAPGGSSIAGWLEGLTEQVESPDSGIEFYDETDDERSMDSFEDARDSKAGKDWLSTAPAGSKALFYDSRSDGGEELDLTSDGKGNWTDQLGQVRTADDLIGDRDTMMRLLPVSEAKPVARITRKEPTDPAALDDAPVGTIVTVTGWDGEAYRDGPKTVRFVKVLVGPPGEETPQWVELQDKDTAESFRNAEQLSYDRYPMEAEELASLITSIEYWPSGGLKINEETDVQDNTGSDFEEKQLEGYSEIADSLTAPEATESDIEFYDENDDERSMDSFEDARDSREGKDWLSSAPAGSQALFYDSRSEGGEELDLTSNGKGTWTDQFGKTYTAEELIADNDAMMRLLPVSEGAPEPDAERVARIFEEHEAIPASELQVGDDSNSSFLKEAPIGTTVSYTADGEDADGPYFDAKFTFTKTGEDEWTASGRPEIEGEKWSAKELSDERDTYTIDKIGEDGQIAELPADEVTPESIAAAPDGTVLEGLSTVVMSNDGSSKETVPARAYKKDGQWFIYADKNDSPIFGQIGFPDGINEPTDENSVLDATSFGEPNSIGRAPVEIFGLSDSVERNYGGDTNDIPTLQRRLDRAQARLDRMGNDIMGRYSDDDMAEVDREIESLAARIDALNNGEDLPVNAPTDLPEIRSIASETENSEAYETDIAALETATTASEQSDAATEIAVKASKNGDDAVAATAVEVVTATKVKEEAETVNTEPQYKKKLSAFAAKLLEKLGAALEREEGKKRRAGARKDAKAVQSAQRRIDAINRTLDFMNLKTDENDGYDPRGTREFVLDNSTIDESSIQRAADGTLLRAEGIYVAPTGEVYRMVWNRPDANGGGGTYAYLVNDFTDPKTGRVFRAGTLAGTLSMHFDDYEPEADHGEIMRVRNGIPELDGGTRYFIPGYIHATGADAADRTPTPFKTIGAGMHGWSAAMAKLDGRRYQHSSWLYPNGRAASHRFHDKQLLAHSRSQREKFFDLLGSPTSKMMRKLGYYKGATVNGVKTAQFNKDQDGKLSSNSNLKLWWGDFDRDVDTNITKLAVVMRKRFKDNPDAKPGVDYPAFLESYIKGDDHTKIEQLSLADVLYTLNYEGGDRAAVATKLRTVLDELKQYTDANGTGFREMSISDIGHNWKPGSSISVSGDLTATIGVLSDVVGFLENPSNKLGKPIGKPESADTVLQDLASKIPASKIEELPKLVPPQGTLTPDDIFNPARSDDTRVSEILAKFDDQEIKDALEEGVKRGGLTTQVGQGADRMAVTNADLAAALNERGIDDYLFVAEIYDSVSGGTENVDALEAYYERNKDMLPGAPAATPRAGYTLAPLQKNESFEGLKYAMDPAPFVPVGTDTEGTSDNPEDIANMFNVTDLREAFNKALTSGDAQVRLQFPGQDGEQGPEANVPVEAVRDALQLRGVDTNGLASDVANANKSTEDEETETVDTSNVPATPVSVGSTPNPDTSVTVSSDDSMSDTTADPATGTVTATDVDLDDNEGPDAYDPEVIMQVIRNQYPDAVEMANGDLIVDSYEVRDNNNNRIEFQTVVVRTRQEFFYTYIRRINHAETDPTKKYQSMRYGRMSQSARALNNTITDTKIRVRKSTATGGPNTMNQWWNKPAHRSRIQMETVNPDTNEPEHVREQPIDRETIQRIVAATSDEAVSEEMVRGIFRHITQHGASQTVLNRLRAQFGMTRESMNTIVDEINEHVASQDRIRRFDTWVSADGETPLFEGDTVRHADGRVGVVVRRIIEHRTHDYGYSDYLYIRFPGQNDRNMTSRRLTLISTSGGTDGSERRGPGAIALPDPTLTTRAQNRMRAEGRINDFAPEQLDTDRFSGPLPTVTIDGTAYPVRGSRQTVVGDNMDTVSGDLSTAQVGDFTTTLDPETGALRVREIVGIEQNPDGTTTVFTFTPNDFGSGTAEGTAYTSDENGNFGRSVPLYRERPVEDTGLASQRDRETLGTAVSEADPANVPEDLKTRVDDMMKPNSTATSREVTDTAIEVSQLPKQPAGATDSVPLDSTRDILTDVKAEAPGDSTINLDTIDTASTLEGSTPEDKMSDAPAWFKDPMTPEAIDEKMGPATPATPVQMPPVTTPFEELPDETAKVPAPGSSGNTRNIDPQGDVRAQVEEAIAAGDKVTFTYNGTVRSIAPAGVKEGREGNINLLGFDDEGDYKTFTLSKIEAAPEAPTGPRFTESDSETPGPRTPDTIRQDIADTEEKLVKARSVRESIGDDPILTEALDARIADLESQLNDLNTEMNQETTQGPEFGPDEVPFGEEAPAAPQVGDPVDAEFVNGSPVGTEITTTINGQKVTYKKNADGTWVTTDTVTIEDADMTFTPNPLSNEQMAARADAGNANLGGEGPSDGGNGGGGSGPKAPTPDSSGGGGQASSTPTSQPIALDSSEITAANEAVAAYNANRPNPQYTEDELKALPVGSFVLLIADKKYVRYIKTGPDTWERKDVNPDVNRGSSVIASKADSARVAARMRTSTVVGSGYTVRPIDNTDGAPATSTTVANALPGFIIHNNTTGEEFTKQEDGTWVSSNNGLPVSDFKMISTVGENVHSFSGNFFVGPNTTTTPVSASTAEIAQYAEGVMDSPEFPGWRKATYEEVYDRALADNTARWTEATGREPDFYEKMSLEMSVETQLKGFDFYINGTVEIGIGKKFDKSADYVKQFMESVEELRVNNPLDKVRVMLSDKPSRQNKNLHGSAMYSQIGATGTTVITINGASILNGRTTLSWNGKNNDNYFAPAYGTVPDIQYALIHEWGHAIDFASGATMREQLWTLIEADPALRGTLSTYAASQPAEAFAELFTQLYLQKHHGASPIELAELIKKVLG